MCVKNRKLSDGKKENTDVRAQGQHDQSLVSYRAAVGALLHGG
jgi:hypothetical protein